MHGIDVANGTKRAAMDESSASARSEVASPPGDDRFTLRSPWARFAAYGLLGWCAEVAFTGVVDYRRTQDPRLLARTSLWMLPIYGLMQPLYERFHDRLRGGAPAPVRALAYAAGFFACEYASGWLLRRVLGRAPWDYGYAKRHVHGLINLDYAPIWALAGLAMEPVHDRLAGRRARRGAAIDAGELGERGAPHHVLVEEDVMHEESIGTMNDLIQLDMDAVNAYDQAIKACSIATIQESLGRFKGDHERHVNDLSNKVRELGGEPAKRPDVTGFVIEGFTAVTAQGDHSALLAMRGNEELTNKKYASALEKTLPEDVRAIVQKNYEDEQRHLAWIKSALDSKLYEAKAA